MRVIQGLSYPVNYDKTLAAAKREAEIGLAIEELDQIEDRWVRLTTGEDYCMADMKKDTLICDIRELVQCCVTFINRIGELEALVKGKKFKGPRRVAKEIRRKET
jgi:hypothetical protein